MADYLKQIADAKKMYESAKDQATKDKASTLANEARKALGNDSIGVNKNYQQFTETYGLNKPEESVKTTTPNANNYINQLNSARKQQTIAQLDKSRYSALSSLNSEQATIQPQYYDKRNQVASQNQQSARNFAEYMANRGGTRAGSNAQAQLMSNMAYQGNIGSLNRQEQQANDDIARRRTDVQNAYQSDIASANAGIEADKMQALINQMNTDRQFGLQEAGLTGQYNGQQTLAAQGQQFNQDFSQEQFSYQQQQDAFNNQLQQQQIQIQAEQFAQQMGLNYAQLNQSQQQFLKSLAQNNSQFNANLNQNQAQFNAGQTGSQQPQQQVLAGMEEAMKLAQNDPRLQTDPYGVAPSADVIKQVINEYYQQLTGTQPSTADMNNFLNYVGGFSNTNSVPDDEMYNYLQSNGYINK